MKTIFILRMVLSNIIAYTNVSKQCFSDCVNIPQYQKAITTIILTEVVNETVWKKRLYLETVKQRN